MKIQKLIISKEKLNLIPEKERIFFVQIMNIMNDINFLYKQSLYPAQVVENEIIQRAQNSMSFLNFEILAGKLFEGWELIRQNFLSQEFSIDYITLLDETGKECLDTLKKYFGKENLICFIRNKFASHYDSTEIKKQLESTKFENFEIYLSEYQGNCLYFMAVILESTAIFDYIDSTNMEKALDKLFADVLEVSTWFQHFLNACIIVIWEKYFEKNYEELDIPNPEKNIRDVFMPFYVNR